MSYNTTQGSDYSATAATSSTRSSKPRDRISGHLYPSITEVDEFSKPASSATTTSMERFDSTSVCSSSAANSAVSSKVPPDDPPHSHQLERNLSLFDEINDTRLIDETYQQILQDEEMGMTTPQHPTRASTAVALEEEHTLTAREQPQTDSPVAETHPDESSDNNRTGLELVQATLIRDVDMHSSHTDTDNNSVPQTSSYPESLATAVAVDSDVAVVEAKPLEATTTKTMSRKLICAVMGMLLIVIGALSVGFMVSAKNKQKDSSANSAWNETTVNDKGNVTAQSQQQIPSSSWQNNSIYESATPGSILKRLRQGGTLRCGVIPGPGLFELDEEGAAFGFDAALCAAVAAAATGDPKNVEYVQADSNIFIMLNTGMIDVAAAGITHTMERQVFQADAKAGFAFTTPYLYQGMQLAGNPDLVDCGDRGLESIAACPNIRVCVVGQSTHYQMLSSYLPGQKLVAIKDREGLKRSLADGTCNVIAHEGYNLAASLVREAGYTGDYKVGLTLFSKEPIAMVTASGDPQFSDFANSIVQSLVVAEFHNITQATADTFQQTDVFGEEYRDLFRHAIAASGHYGELYSRFLEPYSPRQGLNMINYGTSTTNGLMYSHPFGAMSEEGAPFGGTVGGIKARGRLRCGVRTQRTGFAEIQRNNNTGNVVKARGMEIDYCRALAGSIFEANGNKVDFVEVANELEGYEKLAAGDLDLLAGATWNFVNDVNVSGINQGFTFTQPYFFGVQGGSAPEALCLATREDDHLWSSYVYWIAAAIVQAEETNITQGMSNSMPPIYLFGKEFDLMLQDALLTVGNYREMYERNLESIVPRSGRNLLNGNVGAQMLPIPGMIGL